MRALTTRSDTPAAAEKIAIGLLTRREHSAFELQQKLKLRGFAAEIIGAVIERLAAQGWQSDARYAEAYVRMRVARGYGLAAIRAELRQRGVAADCVSAALAEANVDWLDCAQQQVARYYQQPPEDRDALLRRYRHLLNRGFSPEQARQASAFWPDEASMKSHWAVPDDFA
ncbi:MAG: regulatory protein RecX [Halothiobacillus sp.]